MSDFQTQRIDFIDIAKGIAIICVILGHFKSPINSLMYSFHMPIFFLLIGYFVNKKRTIWDFTKNKVRTILIPYLITCIICISLGIIAEEDYVYGFFKWVSASFYGAGFSPHYPNIVSSIGAIWFLWAAFWAMFFLRISLEFNSYLRILFVAILFILGTKTRTYFWMPFSIQAGACATLYLYIGYIFKENQNIITTAIQSLSKEFNYFVILFALIAWFLFIKNYHGFRPYSAFYGKGLDIFGSLCACAIVILLSKQINKIKYISNFLSYFGRYSLLVLCFHNIEWLFFPWQDITNTIIKILGTGENYKLLITMITKVIFDLTIVFILSKIPQVRKLFGYKN